MKLYSLVAASLVTQAIHSRCVHADTLRGTHDRKLPHGVPPEIFDQDPLAPFEGLDEIYAEILPPDDGNNGPATFAIRSGSKCLDVHAPEFQNNGANVQQWDCNYGAPQQTWHWQDGSLVNAGGLCLDVDSHNYQSDGANVQVWACNGEPQQKWRLEHNVRWVNEGGLCLDIHAPDFETNGANAQVWSCNGNANQGFLEWRLY